MDAEENKKRIQATREFILSAWDTLEKPVLNYKIDSLDENISILKFFNEKSISDIAESITRPIPDFEDYWSLLPLPIAYYYAGSLILFDLKILEEYEINNNFDIAFYRKYAFDERYGALCGTQALWMFEPSMADMIITKKISTKASIQAVLNYFDLFKSLRQLIGWSRPHTRLLEEGKMRFIEFYNL